MLFTSLGSREEDHQERQQQQEQQQQLFLFNPRPRQVQTHRLLIHCAELIHRADYAAARQVVSILTARFSAAGDSADRLAHHMARSLSLRLHCLSGQVLLHRPKSLSDPNSIISVNKLTPFLRFAHLTANQAIIEAAGGRKSVHILDFDTGHGLQWPPLLQAMADRSHFPCPPSIHITGTGEDLSLLTQTGRRLHSFSDSLGLDFHFHPLPLSQSSSFSFRIHPSEALAVNCSMFLHKLINDEGLENLTKFLRAVRGMKPTVVTVSEREARHGSPLFLHRFMEALSYYSAVFESLEATLPPTSRERMMVEREWIGREMEDVVAGEGDGRRERHERFERWEALMRAAGFAIQPPSTFALSQARLLLRLHYPSEGYRIEMARGAVFLGWQCRPLFSVSSWR
ncbi:hypothetical protein HPP92_018297 [Vanilla planifolia]|uniref:Scarecrow-like protein 18 n=1 Tax=Vanilla planifolia TaxID=51239 RepID=A0A835UMR5_VANPL|nr:hypothetical protein HPP92_018920 [Vanilla planifolia]KAG0468969.1 hypothetical protein HPP92_018297 [Vanilla planifolia]